jgi:subtilase-type serine protease
MRRRVAFGGIDQMLTSNHDAHTLQGFVEGSWRFDGGNWSVEPYAQLAHVRVDADRFTEQGGSTALTVEGDATHVNLSTAGARATLDVGGAGQTPGWLQLRAGAGYRHASGDLSSPTQAMWSGGGTFTVDGATLADNAWTADLGLGAWLSPRTLLELGYSGQYSDEARDHGANARISVQF